MIIVTILSIWSILSLLKYFPFCKDWISRVDAFILVPTWNFFAPQPNQTDFYLYYRTFSSTTESPWRLVSFGKKRQWYGFIWNPYRRNRKAFFDLCQSMIMLKDLQHKEVFFSVPYLLLLNHVVSICKNDIGADIQFSIAMKIPSVKESEISPAFISEYHKL
jgi:hypothetical protein